MPLAHPPFQTSELLRAIAQGKAALRKGAKGTAVRLVQAGLIQAGIALPNSLGKGGVPDGDFGAETEQALKAFQERVSLEPDGIVGMATLSALDTALHTPAPASGPKPIPIMSTREYKVGTDAPRYIPDPGAGAWKSKPIQPSYLALMATMDLGLSAFVVFGKDATNHLRHYLGNTGKDFTIDLEAMLREVPSARLVFEQEIRQARTLIEILPEGTYPIVSQQWDEGYNEQEENSNWFFAIGGYRAYGSGTVRIYFARGQRQYELSFEYHVKDRYNWDGGKEVRIPSVFGDEPITITDEFMGEFHRQGLAREFYCVGSVRRQLNWTQGLPISQSDLYRPAGRT